MDQHPFDRFTAPPPPAPPLSVPPRPPLPESRPAPPSGLDADLIALGIPEASLVDAPAASTPRPLWQRVSTWVAVYGVVLALIAFWPQPVDSGAGAGAFLAWVTDRFPLLTYPRIEFAANILLFVPFGVGLALLLPALRYLVMPAALLVSLAIESVQAVLIAARTPSVYDIVANVSGACLGLIAVAIADALRRRP